MITHVQIAIVDGDNLDSPNLIHLVDMFSHSSIRRGVIRLDPHQDQTQRFMIGPPPGVQGSLFFADRFMPFRCLLKVARVGCMCSVFC